ncbi:amidohydrolase [Nocardia vinacea]|uniref:2-amino-3-carboxymuconate-6-semialdehyde decarboxylase n=1 Tax=Nocardia vinacea TaxID=96468 RepID=A0ABZ1YW53_9NOCA|nr:amidohydrolase family protein [Nocardia vinacea]
MPRAEHPPIVDVHAHLFPIGLPDMHAITGDARWPSLAVGGQDGRIMCGRNVFRQVRAPLWDRAARIAELDAAGIATQVVSPVPVTLAYWADTPLAVRFMRALNDALAREVAADDRLIGLGAVPLQDVGAAIDELVRIRTDLGLRGAEIGTVIAGRELDDPQLRPFFGAAQELDAVLAIHPMDGGAGVIRRSGQPYDFGIAMLTDTAMAATALVFGGVLDDCPDLRVVLAHGCGSYAWTYPRLRAASQHWGQGDPARLDELTRALWVDSLVFDPVHLSVLAHRFGADRIMVGTDHPFVPGELTAGPNLVRSAVDGGLLTAAEATAILATNAARFLGSVAADPGLPPTVASGSS